MANWDEFEDALTKTGFGKFNLALLCISGLCLFTVTADVYSSGYILTAAQCDLELNTANKGLLTTIHFLGTISGSHIWGYLGDTQGRKHTLIITIIISFLCTLIASFMEDFNLFIFFRFWSGFFMAGTTIIYVYLGEFHSAKHRSIMIMATGLFVSLACVLLPGVAWIIIPQSWSWNFIIDYKPWRLFIVLCSCPSLLVALALLPFPESPKFLFEQGKNHEALEVLKRIYSSNTKRKSDDFPVTKLQDEREIREKPESFIKSMYVQTIPLFKNPHSLNTFVVCVLQFGYFAISSGLLLWYPDIVNQLSEFSQQNSSSISVCDAIFIAVNKNKSEEISCNTTVDDSVFIQNIIIGAAYCVGFIKVTLLINYVGKRTLLIVNLLVSSISGVLLLWVTNSILINYLFVGLLVASGMCVCITTAAVVDMFPTHLRAMAVSISLMVGRLGSVAASSTIGLLLELNCIATFIILSSLLFGCAVLSLMIPNTSNRTQKRAK